MTPLNRARRRGRGKGVTLIEMIFFGALGAVVLVGVATILTKGSRLLEVGRRSSGAATDLRVLMETLTEDVGELVYLEDGEPYDSASAGADKGIKFVVRSTRYEAGLTPPPTPTLRRVEYKAGPAVGTSKLREVIRSVTLLGAGAPPGGPPPAAGDQATRTLIKGLSRLRAWPLASVQLPDRRFNLVAATDTRARAPGATVACFVVDVTVGEPPTTASVDQTAVSSLVTKVWCRNRILEMNRGGTQ